MATIFRLGDLRLRQRPVFFSRPELNQLLSLYSRQVARGEWRDYAIDQHDGVARFAVFRHSQESPLYTVVKTAAGAGRQGDFTLLSGRQRLASGKALGDVLRRLPRRYLAPALRSDSESAG
jgi:hypothetical protein